jgi:hypothetical protein
MLLVELYGMGPVTGILTTTEEWLVSWFPLDTNVLAHVDPLAASFNTPLKQKSSSASTETESHSPPGGTPSQQRGITHSIDDATEDFLEVEDQVTDEMERLLCATHVMNIYKDPIRVKTLGALEDLGRGSTGKAWLRVTATQPRSAACVLKFDNRHSRSVRLVKEREMWHLLYSEFSTMVKLEHWSGADALVMPHFSTVLESEREQYKDEISLVLTTHFMQNGKVHKDVRWSNIGKYRNRSGAVALIVFDLYDVEDYDLDVHHDWIEKAMHYLFENE